MATLETLKEMLSVIGIAMVTEQGNLSSITSSIRNVLQCKVGIFLLNFCIQLYAVHSNKTGKNDMLGKLRFWYHCKVRTLQL